MPLGLSDIDKPRAEAVCTSEGRHTVCLTAILSINIELM